MKTRAILWILFIVLSWTTTNVFSQNSGIPSGISYQAVARDAQGVELNNKSIAVRLSLIRGSADGDAQWIESQSVTTDQFGLFNLIIGEGSRETGSLVDKFSDINWGADRYFLKVEIDFGSGYRNLGIMPLLSVPYALYAATAGSSKGTDNQTIHLDTISNMLSIDRGDSVDLSCLFRKDYAREIITKIELRGTLLSISQGNQMQSVDLSSLNQIISYDSINNRIILSNGGSANLPDFIKNSETIKFYISNLLLSGDSLIIYQGGIRKTIDLSHFDKPYTYQHLSLSNNTLKLSNDTSGIDLSKYLDNNNQQLTYDSLNNRLILTNGGIVNLPAFIKNSESAKFYISNLFLSGDSLIIHQGDTTKIINLGHFDKAQIYQHLSLSSNTLKLSNDSANIDLSKYLDNKNQHLIQNGDSLKLTYDSGGADLSKYNKYLSLIGNALFLTNNPNLNPVDLSRFQDNYYLQWDPGLNLYTLKDSNGQTKGDPIYLAPYIQDLRTANDRLWITGNKDSTIVDLRKYIQQITLNKDSNVLYVTNGNGVTSFNITQSLVLNDSVLSLSKDPNHTSINLNAFDNQKLHVYSPNKLTIDNGNSVYVRTDTSSEIQKLVLKNDTLSLTKDPSFTKVPLVSYDRQKLHLDSNNHLSIDRGDTVDLSKYLDNTDNQQLSFSNGQLSLTNGGSVNIRENLIAFRATRIASGTTSPITTILAFNTELMDTYNAYDPTSGTFTVPTSGAGIYYFTVSYNYASSYQVLKVMVNATVVETLQYFPTYSFMLLLNVGDSVNIQIVNPSDFSFGYGSFMGYRLNQ